MNLLVTNTRNPQAYAIMRALRPHAKKIVASMEGDNRLSAWLSHAARSRLVDKRYFTPSPAADWRRGRIQKENTEQEESYVQAILRICEQEKIDTIFPSFDPHVYVFSKNKERFEKLGILIPVPDYEAVITPLDKYKTIRAAQQVGFPCPKTFLPETADDLTKIAMEIGFPLIVKRRFTAGGRGMFLVNNLAELLDKVKLADANRGSILIQEYIPSDINDNIAITLDKNGDLKMVFCLRALFRLNRFHRVRALDSPISHAYAADAARMVQKLGWWGGIMVQSRIDSRDQTPKLMEMNPRIGLVLWYRIAVGINEPLMILKIARGEEVEPIRKYPVETIFVDPLEHAVNVGLGLADLFIHRFRIGILRKEPIDRSHPPISLSELIRSVKSTYFSDGPRVCDLYTKYFFQDPLISLVWWVQRLTHRWIQNRPRALGR